MSLLLQGKAVSFTPLEMIRPMGGNFVNCSELPQDLFKDPRRTSNFEHHLLQTECTAKRSLDQDVASLSKLYSPHASPYVEAKTVTLNVGHFENGLFSSSMSDMLNKKSRLPSDDVFVGQSINATQSNFAEDEVFESLEEIEAQTIGDLLPDDDDLLSEAIHNHGHIAQSNWADAEDDLFFSVGGMELESDDKFICKKTSEIGCSRAFNGQERGLANISAPEFPHSTRTLFVKTNDGNIKNMELRVLFEDNPSEKDIGECVLLVTNLESTISNDDLLHIFGAHGEIKEIYEIPHKGHHKFIRFYDVGATEAALLALNGCDIAGKRIKVALCSLRDSSFSSSMQQLTLDLVEEESSSFRKQCYSRDLQSECFVPSGLIARVTDTCTGLQNGAIQGMHTAFKMQSSSSVESNFHGISSSMPCNISSPVRVAMAGNCNNQSSNCDLRHSFGQMNLGFQSVASLPEFSDGVISDIHFNSSRTVSGMAVNISPSLVNGDGNTNFHRIGAGGYSRRSFEQNESEFNLSGTGSCRPYGNEYIWNNCQTRSHHHPSSMTWENLPAFRNNIPIQTPQLHRLARGPSHMPNLVLSQHLHVGSAPAVEPLLWDGRHTFTGDAITFNPSSLDHMGYSSCSPLQSLELASHNIFISAHVGVPSPQERGYIFRGRSRVNTMPNSHDAPNNCIRSRRCDLNASQADSRKQYELDIDRIIHGDDLRTTLMIKNIPNKYTSKMLLATIDEQHKGTYDFIYLPIDFKNKCNVGYAFINMTDPQHIIPLYQVFNGKRWEKFNSEKVAYLAYARIQGKAALIAHFQNSSLMNEDKRLRPILFHSDGPNAGDQEPFPIPVGVSTRPKRSSTNSQNHQGSLSGSSSEEGSSNATLRSPSSSTKNLE